VLTLSLSSWKDRSCPISGRRWKKDTVPMRAQRTSFHRTILLSFRAPLKNNFQLDIAGIHYLAIFFAEPGHLPNPKISALGKPWATALTQLYPILTQICYLNAFFSIFSSHVAQWWALHTTIYLMKSLQSTNQKSERGGDASTSQAR